jgi:hypothetical protein
VNRSQEFVQYEIRYVTVKPLTGGEVRAEMHSGKDSTQRCFLIRGREAIKGTFYCSTSEVTLKSK